MIAAYRKPDCTEGLELMGTLIASVSQGVPAALHEVTVLGRTLKNAAADTLPTSTSPGPPTDPRRR